MTITLPETTAWSTGAAWPVDGEPATIESITDQVQELKDRSNYLNSKTTQLGFQILQNSMLAGMATFVGYSGTDYSNASSLVASNTFSAAQAGDQVVVDVFAIASILTNTGRLRISWSENGGGEGFAVETIVAIDGNGRPYHLEFVHQVTTPGDLVLFFRAIGNGTQSIGVNSIYTGAGGYWGKFQYMRPVT